jgi:hypothetical protein
MTVEPGTDPNGGPLADPIAESRRLVTLATAAGVTSRLLGGVAVCLQAPQPGPLLPRPVRDIDFVIPRGTNRAFAALLADHGYSGEEMFNAVHGSHRLIFNDERNARHIDVFVGSFSMCHVIPIADRLDRQPLTVPLAELLLTKLQIVKLTERDQRDIYNLCFHHEVVADGEPGIESPMIAELCAKDWGLWRTATLTIAHSHERLGDFGLDAGQQALITERLESLTAAIDASPKSRAWRLRSRVGGRVRWYEEPEEPEVEAAGA